MKLWKGPALISLHYVNKTLFFSFQLLKDRPRLIQINDQLVSLEPGSSVNIIPAGAILEIVGTKRFHGNSFLVCKDKTDKMVTINANAPVNITAIDDENEYTLKELTDNVMLPKCIEFDNISPYDIVIYDDLWANNLLVMAAGPFKVNSVVELEFVLGWNIPLGPKGEQFSQRTVLIPRERCQKQKVKIQHFPSRSERLKYNRKYFSTGNNSNFVNHKLYAMKMDPLTYPSILWLQDRNPLKCETNEPLPLDKGMRF